MKEKYILISEKKGFSFLKYFLPIGIKPTDHFCTPEKQGEHALFYVRDIDIFSVPPYLWFAEIRGGGGAFCLFPDCLARPFTRIFTH